jgi:RNA polymerase sigma-70 factor (ECF subfamily)
VTTHPPHLRPVKQPAETTQETPDSALVAAARRGDVSAWSALYELRYGEVYRRLRYLCGDPALAEELAQETFAQAMTHHRRYDGCRPFGAWLHGIALNVARKHQRKVGNRTRAMARLSRTTDLVSRGDDPAGRHLRGERSRMLYAVLQDLPDRWREAFILREIEGLSPAEAAQCLDITTSNLAVRLNRARGRIREELVRRGWVGGNER